MMTLGSRFSVAQGLGKRAHLPERTNDEHGQKQKMRDGERKAYDSRFCQAIHPRRIAFVC